MDRYTEGEFIGEEGGGCMKKEELRAVLEGCYWPEELEAEKYFFRTQDDCDGDLSSGIGVVVDAQGDVWVETVSKSLESCRYRMPLIGGGMSPRVRNALVLLALAIKLDNETNGRV